MNASVSTSMRGLRVLAEGLFPPVLCRSDRPVWRVVEASATATLQNQHNDGSTTARVDRMHYLILWPGRDAVTLRLHTHATLGPTLLLCGEKIQVWALHQYPQNNEKRCKYTWFKMHHTACVLL